MPLLFNRYRAAAGGGGEGGDISYVHAILAGNGAASSELGIFVWNNTLSEFERLPFKFNPSGNSSGFGVNGFAISPSGKFIVVSYAGGQGFEIFVLDEDTLEYSTIDYTVTSGQFYHFCFDPLGEYLLCSGVSVGLYVTSIDEVNGTVGTPTDKADGYGGYTGNGYGIDIAPQGDVAICWGRVSGVYGLFVYDRDGGSWTRRSDTPIYPGDSQGFTSTGCVAWSPDGNYVVCGTNSSSSSSRRGLKCYAKSDLLGTHVQDLETDISSFGNDNDQGCNFSPAGDYLVYHNTDGTEFLVWEYDGAGGFTHIPAMDGLIDRDGPLSISEDGRHIVIMATGSGSQWNTGISGAFYEIDIDAETITNKPRTSENFSGVGGSAQARVCVPNGFGFDPRVETYNITVANSGVAYGYNKDSFGSINRSFALIRGYELGRVAMISSPPSTENFQINFEDAQFQLTQDFFTSVTIEGTNGPVTLMSADATFSQSSGASEWEWDPFTTDDLDWVTDVGQVRAVTFNFS